MQLSTLVSRLPRRMRAAAVAVPALLAVACSSVTLEQEAGDEVPLPAAATPVVAREVGDAATVVPAMRPAVDVVAVDPSVAPGTCEVIVYTPLTASTPRSGELCVPESPDGDLVILLHGGGGFTGSPDDMEVWRDVHLAAGRATFAIDYALVDDGLDEALWPVPEQNVKAAVQYVRRDGTLALGEIVVHGLSAGARLGGIVATTPNDPLYVGDELWSATSDAVDGAILFYGYYSGFQFYADDYYGGHVPDAADVRRATDGDDAAMLLIHAVDDSLIPVDESIALAAAVVGAGGDAELVVVEGDHAFDHVDDDGMIAALTPAGRDLIDDIDGFVAGLGPEA